MGSRLLQEINMSPVPTNAPIDALHRDCLQAQHEIRQQIELLKFHASIWKPAPMPPIYGKETP